MKSRRCEFRGGPLNGQLRDLYHRPSTIELRARIYLRMVGEPAFTRTQDGRYLRGIQHANRTIVYGWEPGNFSMPMIYPSFYDALSAYNSG